MSGGSHAVWNSLTGCYEAAPRPVVGQAVYGWNTIQSQNQGAHTHDWRGDPNLTISLNELRQIELKKVNYDIKTLEGCIAGLNGFAPLGELQETFTKLREAKEHRNQLIAELIKGK